MTTARGEIEQAARAYESAVGRGVPPLRHVMGQLGLTRATAIRRVRAARDYGLLGEDTRPTYSGKLIAVADSLSVDPERLRQAVLDHADGDLRVQPRLANDE